MLYDLEAVKANIRNREGKRVFYLGEGVQLTSQARDYLQAERIPICSPREAKPEVYRLLGGGWLSEKPEHMTHLNGEVLVPKTHPRIRFRGAMDTLQAELLLCQSQGIRVSELEEILVICRHILRWDVLEEPMEETRLCGLSQEEQRRRSQDPGKYYGQPHFMPSYQDGPAILGLNRARCAARAAELAGVAAFRDEEGNPTREDILRVLNRISSMLYILMIQEKAASYGH